MFGDSEVLSADTIFAGKAMVSKISDDLRAKIEFVTARVSGQYEGLKLSIINKNEGLVDIEALFFKGYSERQWSKISGIPQRTICYRKNVILQKLKKILKN